MARSLGDLGVFGVLFDRHAATIHGYLSRRVGTDLADDLTAETFLVALRKRAAYDPSRPDARPWLYGIATRLLQRHHRQEARQYRALARTGVDPVAENHADAVAARVAAGALTRDLAAGLARLGRGDRDVLLLIAWGGLSYSEAADSLGIPVGTVRSRLNRARKKLRAVLGENGTDPESHLSGG
ncbi:MAG: RNA polymerase sigma factor [Catenulispora sp.]|nr:RNA polymerase sigma factor [Catenulispora sp.]